ncbi:hypothetical protein Bbelb_296770 [Branchiostoma belcheri]|nr:hypothetical protein Bbelb_296770 [Branchiostoma belcheri]
MAPPQMAYAWRLPPHDIQHQGQDHGKCMYCKPGKGLGIDRLPFAAVSIAVRPADISITSSSSSLSLDFASLRASRAVSSREHLPYNRRRQRVRLDVYRKARKLQPCRPGKKIRQAAACLPPCVNTAQASDLQYHQQQDFTGFEDICGLRCTYPGKRSEVTVVPRGGDGGKGGRLKPIPAAMGRGREVAARKTNGAFIRREEAGMCHHYGGGGNGREMGHATWDRIMGSEGGIVAFFS